MSDVARAIRERRSVRKYLQKPVPEKNLREILEAATWAPSAHNAQPWRFVVLTEGPAKRALADAMAQAWLHDLEKDGVPKAARLESAHASAERFAGSPVLVVACVTLKDMDSYADAKRRKSERDLAIQSLSAAIQNLLLTAYAKGLGACWYCAPAFCQAAVRKALKIPEEVEPQALITLGYPDEKPEAPLRNPLEVSVFWDSWGKP
jgi:F420 biosynthesis protein FbiB-like protein